MKQKNREKRLNARRRSHDAMLKQGSREAKVSARMMNGGFTRPGSMNK